MEREPNDLRAHFQLGDVLRRLNRLDDAQREFEHVARTDPGYPGLNLARGQLAEARGLANQYADYPVDRWRKLFAEVGAQLDEIEGKGAAAARPLRFCSVRHHPRQRALHLRRGTRAPLHPH